MRSTVGEMRVNFKLGTYKVNNILIIIKTIMISLSLWPSLLTLTLVC